MASQKEDKGLGRIKAKALAKARIKAESGSDTTTNIQVNSRGRARPTPNNPATAAAPSDDKDLPGFPTNVSLERFLRAEMAAAAEEEQQLARGLRGDDPSPGPPPPPPPGPAPQEGGLQGGGAAVAGVGAGGEGVPSVSTIAKMVQRFRHQEPLPAQERKARLAQTSIDFHWVGESKKNNATVNDATIAPLDEYRRGTTTTPEKNCEEQSTSTKKKDSSNQEDWEKFRNLHLASTDELEASLTGSFDLIGSLELPEASLDLDRRASAVLRRCARVLGAAGAGMEEEEDGMEEEEDEAAAAVGSGSRRFGGEAGRAGGEAGGGAAVGGGGGSSAAAAAAAAAALGPPEADEQSPAAAIRRLQKRFQDLSTEAFEDSQISQFGNAQSDFGENDDVWKLSLDCSGSSLTLPSYKSSAHKKSRYQDDDPDEEEEEEEEETADPMGEDALRGPRGAGRRGAGRGGGGSHGGGGGGAALLLRSDDLAAPPGALREAAAGGGNMIPRVFPQGLPSVVEDSQISQFGNAQSDFGENDDVWKLSLDCSGSSLTLPSYKSSAHKKSRYQDDDPGEEEEEEEEKADPMGEDALRGPRGVSEHSSNEVPPGTGENNRPAVPGGAAGGPAKPSDDEGPAPQPSAGPAAGAGAGAATKKPGLLPSTPDPDLLDPLGVTFPSPFRGASGEPTAPCGGEPDPLEVSDLTNPSFLAAAAASPIGDEEEDGEDSLSGSHFPLLQEGPPSPPPGTRAPRAEAVQRPAPGGALAVPTPGERRRRPHLSSPGAAAAEGGGGAAVSGGGRGLLLAARRRPGGRVDRQPPGLKRPRPPKWVATREKLLYPYTPDCEDFRVAMALASQVVKDVLFSIDSTPICHTNELLDGDLLDEEAICTCEAHGAKSKISNKKSMEPEMRQRRDFLSKSYQNNNHHHGSGMEDQLTAHQPFERNHQHYRSCNHHKKKLIEEVGWNEDIPSSKSTSKTVVQKSYHSIPFDDILDNDPVVTQLRKRIQQLEVVLRVRLKQDNH